MALFITFEGGEGCGKSTQSRLLYRRLHSLALPVLLTHEPGITPLGKKITSFLKWSNDITISPVAELLLFNASRAQLVTDILLPHLNSGDIVICDRYADSTMAYQGYGRGLDIETVKMINHTGMQGLKPDLTIFLDVPVELGLARKNDAKPDRYQTEDIEFHKRVREGYLALAETESGRWLVIDGTKTKDEIAGIIWQSVRGKLPK